MTEEKLVIRVNSDAKMSRGKYAAQAVHAALTALGVHPRIPVIVLGGKRSEIEQMSTVIQDAGRTEVEPGTVTAGTDYAPDIRSLTRALARDMSERMGNTQTNDFVVSLARAELTRAFDIIDRAYAAQALQRENE